METVRSVAARRTVLSAAVEKFRNGSAKGVGHLDQRPNRWVPAAQFQVA
jgi:hypothetical protein